MAERSIVPDSTRRGRSAVALAVVTATLVSLLTVSVTPTGASIAPIGTVSEHPGLLDGPTELSAGADGNLWFLNGTTSIGVSTPGGDLTTFGDPSIVDARSIATGSDGNVWFTNRNPGSIGRITPDGAITNYTDPGLSLPGSLVDGPDGNLWFINATANGAVGRITPAGVITLFTDAAIGFPSAIGAGPDGNLWITDFNDSIHVMTPAGAVIATHSGSAIQDPGDIVAGPDGNLWYANFRSNSCCDWGTIGRITTDGTSDEFDATPDLDPIGSLTAAADGNVWFVSGGEAHYVEPDGTIHDVAGTFPITGLTLGPDDHVWYSDVGNQLGIVTPSGREAVLADIGFPDEIVAGTDGNLWFTSADSDAIGRMAPDGDYDMFIDPIIASPEDIAVGPDGNLWFTTKPVLGAHTAIGRITPDGIVTEFSDPAFTRLADLSAGPDGNIWFTDQGTDVVGRMTPSGAVTTFTDPTLRNPGEIITGPDGRLWFLDSGGAGHPGAFLGQVTTAGDLTTLPVGPGWLAYALEVGPDGNVWFTGSVGSPRTYHIGRMTPAGTLATFTDPSVTRSWGIASGPDGNLWFTNETGDSIGRITPDGTITDFTDPTIDGPAGITSGPDGRLWFANSVGNSIGAIAATETCHTAPFPDVPIADPFCVDITWLSDEGITQGNPDGTFGPTAEVDRQSMAAFLHRYADPTFTPPSTATFPDVPTNHPFFDEIEWLASTGITQGTPNGTFAPTADVDRRSMAAFLRRLDQLD